MARRTRSVSRFRLMVLTVALAVQVPAWLVAARLSGRPLLVSGVVAALTIAFLVGIRRPFEDGPKPPLLLYLGLYPFFAWWTGALAFWLLGPLSLVGLATGAPAERLLGAGLGGALLVGLSALDRRPRLARIEVRLPGLPAALDGYRVAQLSDIHCGSYAPPSAVAGWVARLNALEADLVAVTGDLITTGDRHVEGMAEALSGLRARDGVFVSLGNHDYFTDGEAVATALARRGLRVLRNEGEVVGEGPRRLYVAGADDTWTGRADVPRALGARPTGMPALLLAHDPNLFPEAARRGVSLTLSGHTHGGQLAVPGLARRLTLARLITPFVAGLYRVDGAALYVSRGAGTTGPPVRLGARGELTLLTLRTA